MDYKTKVLGQTFQQKTLRSFQAMRDDMDQFRTSMNDWIIFLNEELRRSREQIQVLEKKLEDIQMRRNFGV